MFFRLARTAAAGQLTVHSVQNAAAPQKNKKNKAKPKSNAQKTGYRQCSDSLFKKYIILSEIYYAKMFKKNF